MLDGAAVEVETSVHPELDLILVRLRSSLLRLGRLGVGIECPGVSARLNPDPADFDHPESHHTRVVARGARGMSFERRIDATRYYVKVGADREIATSSTGPHAWRLGRCVGRAERGRAVFSQALARRLAERRAGARRRRPATGNATGAGAPSSISRAAPMRAPPSSSAASCSRST